MDWSSSRAGSSSRSPTAETTPPGPIGFSDFAGEWRGTDGLRKATVDYLNVWEDYRFEVERMIDLGDRVLVLETQTARGRRSGAVLSQDVAALLTIRDGLIVRWEYYWERADALEAAGVDG